MLAVALVFAQLVGSKPPKPTVVRIGAPLNYRIREVPPPHESIRTDYETGDLIVEVGNQAARVFSPEPSASVLPDTLFGKDGSIYAHYRYNFDPGGHDEYVIITDHKKKNLLAKAFDPSGPYQDAKNYVRTFNRHENAIGIPYGPNTTVQIIDGVEHEIGDGYPLKVWWPNRMLVTIDGGYDSTAPPVLRLYDKGRAIDIGEFTYLGLVGDARIDKTPPLQPTAPMVCAASRGLRGRSVNESPSRGRTEKNGEGVTPSTIHPQSDTIAAYSDSSIYLWRNGAFVSARSVPGKWQFQSLNSRGDVLLRKQGIQTSDSPDMWTVAILRGNTIHPISFHIPTPKAKVRMVETSRFDNNGTIGLYVTTEDQPHTYDLMPGA